MKRLALEAKLINYCNICGKKYSYKYHHKHKYDKSKIWTNYICENCSIVFRVLRNYEFTYIILNKYKGSIHITYSFEDKILFIWLVDYNSSSKGCKHPILELRTSFKDAFKHIKKYYDNLIFV